MDKELPSNKKTKLEDNQTSDPGTHRKSEKDLKTTKTKKEERIANVTRVKKKKAFLVIGDQV